MTEAAISTLKDHLPEMVHLAEQGTDIQITRHGKPVAVLISLERYQQAFPKSQGIFTTWQHWRTQYPTEDGFTDAEQAAMYQHTRAQRAERPSSWE